MTDFLILCFLRAIDFLGGLLGIIVMMIGIPFIGWLVTP